MVKQRMARKDETFEPDSSGVLVAQSLSSNYLESTTLLGSFQVRNDLYAINLKLSGGSVC